MVKIVALACVLITVACSTAKEATLDLRMEEWQCVGTNGLSPDRVKAALLAAGIFVYAVDVPELDPPVCEACYPMCSYGFDYRVRITTADLNKARAVIAGLENPAPVGNGRQAITPPPLSLPPSVSAAEQLARESALARLRAALATQRSWCWGAGGASFGGKGGFTLHADGEATAFGAGSVPGVGRWTFGDDGRIEVILPRSLHHFGVEANGRLGFNHSQGREELHACKP